MRSDNLLQRLNEDAIVAEQMLLGAVLTSPLALAQVLPRLSEDAFLLIRHRHIWSALRGIASSAADYDVSVVAHRLRAMGKEAETGGMSYLLQLASQANSAHADTYATLVLNAYTRRRLLQALDKSYSALANPDLTTEDVVREVESAIFPIQSASSSEVNAGDVAERLLVAEQPECVLTGFPTLDDVTGGLRPGQFIVVGAATSMGKTAFLLSVALNVARAGKRVWVWSGEMSPEEISARLLAAISGVSLHDIVRRRVVAADVPRLRAAVDALKALKIVINADVMTLASLRLHARRQTMAGAGLLIVDYLGLLNVPEQRERRLQLAVASWMCKAIAMECGVPVLAAAQLNRDFSKQADKRPGLHDFKESGDIENNADVALGLYRDAVYNQDAENAALTELLILKQRNGPRGKVYLYFDERCAHFKAEARVETIRLSSKAMAARSDVDEGDDF